MSFNFNELRIGEITLRFELVSGGNKQCNLKILRTYTVGNHIRVMFIDEKELEGQE